MYCNNKIDSSKDQLLYSAVWLFHCQQCLSFRFCLAHLLFCTSHTSHKCDSVIPIIYTPDTHTLRITENRTSQNSSDIVSCLLDLLHYVICWIFLLELFIIYSFFLLIFFRLESLRCSSIIFDPFIFNTKLDFFTGYDIRHNVHCIIWHLAEDENTTCFIVSSEYLITQLSFFHFLVFYVLVIQYNFVFFRFYNADICDTDELEKVFSSSPKFDACIHFAGKLAN